MFIENSTLEEKCCVNIRETGGTLMPSFETMNDLPAEVKILIVTGQTLVDETRKKMKSRSTELDLTGKLQLKSDCADLEKRIKKFSKGKYKEKDIEELNLSIIRLRTVSEGLMKNRELC